MTSKPLIGITCMTRKRGIEFRDRSLDLSMNYPEVVSSYGGLAVAIPTVAQDTSALLKALDGILLTGGGDVDPNLYPLSSAQDSSLALAVDKQRDILEIQVIKTALQNKIPLFAICRGIQILNVALGGTLHIDLPSEVKSHINHRIVDTPRSPAHIIDINPDSSLAILLQRTQIAVNSTHHQAVRQLGDGLIVSATAPDGVVEAVEYPDHPFFIGVQFHPEQLSVNNTNPCAELWKGFIKACQNYHCNKHPY